MFYAIRQSLLLKHDYETLHNFKYDLAILTRMDCRFTTPFVLDRLDPSVIHFPLGEGFEIDGKRRLGAAQAFGLDSCFNDQVLVSASANLDAFIDLYDLVGVYCNERHVVPNNETLMAYHLRQKGIKYNFADFVTYELLRPI